jgi:hypothetical protein
MTVQRGEISSSNNNNSSRYNSKDDIINVTKAAVRKSILMQIARVRAANRFL